MRKIVTNIVVAMATVMMLTTASCSIESNDDSLSSESVTTTSNEIVPDETTVSTSSDNYETTMPVVEKNPDLRNFEWGTPLEDVKSCETLELVNEEHKIGNYGTYEHAYTELTFSSTPWNDYDVDLVVEVDDEYGLYSIIYRITGGKSRSFYVHLLNKLKNEYGEPDFANNSQLIKDFRWESQYEDYSIQLFYMDPNESTFASVSFVNTEIQYEIYHKD